MSTRLMGNKWDDLHKENRFQPKYPDDNVVRFISKQFPRDLKKRRNLKVLDLGCGAGRHTVFLAEEGFQAYATDTSERALKITQKDLRIKSCKLC